MLRAGDLELTSWQLSHVCKAIEQLEEERFAEGERTMSEAELPNLYEPAGYVAKEPIDRRHLVDQLAAVVAAASSHEGRNLPAQRHRSARCPPAYRR